MHSPITVETLKKLQGIAEYLKYPDRIGLALKQYPEIMDPAISAIHEASNNTTIQQTATSFDKLPNTAFNNNLQRIRNHLSDPQLWVQSGFTKEQLLKIAEAFIEAKTDIARRIEDDQPKTVDSHCVDELKRQIHIQKRTRHLKKDTP